RLLLGDHTLSVERLRYPARYRLPIPREARLCRFCQSEVEDEVHALLICDASPLLKDLRDKFLLGAFLRDEELEPAFAEMARYDFLRRLVSSRKAVEWLARYVCDVFTLFDRFQRYVPDGYGIP
ncbi:hypothetical protein DFH06DRAFT_972824, partial [Mycena polygramma]